MAGYNPKQDVPILKPSELFDKRRQREEEKQKSYNKILEQIYIRIRTSSREGSDPWITYVVPPFLLGLPKIDLQDCIVYIVYMLRAQTYEVRYTYPNLLYISWKHHEKDYILKGSPIMSAMLSTQSSKPKGELRAHSGARVQFAEQILSSPSAGYGGASYGSNPRTQQTQQYQQNQQNQQQNQYYDPPVQQRQPVGRAPPRSVTEYQPPSSFLDAVERPVAEPRRSALDDFLNF